MVTVAGPQLFHVCHTWVTGPIRADGGGGGRLAPGTSTSGASRFGSTGGFASLTTFDDVRADGGGT